jgi:hypothetical protein
MRPIARPRFAVALLLATTLVLGGCASVLRVDNQVESFASWDSGKGVPAAPQYYLFERLPSQRQGPAANAQTELEQWTMEGLAALGWRVAGADDPVPAWRVQVQASSVRLPHAPWEDPRDGFWSGVGIYGSRGGWGVGGRFGWPMYPYHTTPYYQRQVSLVVREADTGRVVYETSAAHDGRWSSTPELWKAIIRAALSEFPVPRTGSRQVNIDLPR